MKVLLEGLLPRCFPGMDFLCISHEGKNDLEKSIPRKLRAWQEPGVRFVIVRDNDGGNCRQLKEHLVKMCREADRDDTLIRIAVQELEAWYFGEPEALAEAFCRDDLRDIGRKARYRNPDRIERPSRELARLLVPDFHKISGARKMAAHLDPGRNRSGSFSAFVKGVERIWAEIGDHRR